jgi:hypothetical protein
MTRRGSRLLATCSFLAVVAAGGVTVMWLRHAEEQQRQTLMAMLQPVALSNCRLERFGEPHDGGYLLCGNLLDGVQVGYSYGISGYDQWGCDVSTRLNVPVHEYDCFDTTRPACPATTVFHAECVGDGAAATVDGRRFDTIANQLAKNGDGLKRLVVKIDVEGAEWDTLLSVADSTLRQIDQLVVEFHWLRPGNRAVRRLRSLFGLGWGDETKYIRVVERLQQFFEVGHIHFNNFSCSTELAPFSTIAYEVLFVNRRLAVVDPSRTVGRGLHPLDAPNDPSRPECPSDVGSRRATPWTPRRLQHRIGARPPRVAAQSKRRIER